ncbi:MAG TPA: 1-(5-phosphoribosyl)-5-[(5-phosphoribosylamino)methylideneamino] imidazole-4-carboxamide isomerase [Gaiellaceae bacterium]|jgi:phosphoribosylformimino-5-aminoimidazole carboxamide ribotide isomerase|nr:1-(5-phosphoribosyl)-5-[(5-phosphoribosylamino)methylideneamino] imidazole-4-carboxamide isomerase [Gaiellaceae bacterium]
MWFDLDIDVIPAVDVLGDNAVRLHRGSYDEVVERAADPFDLALDWVRQGAKRIHLVDLDGARSGKVRPKLVEQIARCGVPVQASGGIRTRDDALALLFAGADRVVVGTAAWPDPEPWLELGEQVVLALDVLGGEVRTGGWLEGSGVTLEQALDRSGDARVLVTGIDRDGTLAGPDLDLVRSAAQDDRRVLAAGGVRSPDDVDALAAAGAEAAVVGRALFATR